MRGLGIVVIRMGAALLGLVPWLRQTRKITLGRRTWLADAPLLGVVFGLGWVSSALAFVRRHIRVVNIAGAAMLMILGVLMVTGVWVQWIYQLQNLSGTFLTPI